jgi:transcription elongation factor GreB
MSTGAPNYITPEGAKKLQAELVRLRTGDRPKIVVEVADAAAQGDRSENAEYIYGKKKLREIDRRMHWLIKRLESAHVVHPRTDATSKVFFGAIVEVEDEEGHRAAYRLVGEDEIDLALGWVSYKSPVGRALLGKSEGDTVRLVRPSGEVELTINGVRYPTEP